MLKRLLVITASFLLLSACSAFPQRYEGVSYDWTTKQPLPATIIKLTCYTNRETHGSEVLREVRVTSDAKGLYVFEPEHTKGCASVFVQGEKPGYVDAVYASLILSGPGTDARPPKQLYMVQEKELVLEQIKMKSGTIEISDNFEYRFYDFQTVKQMAKTPEHLLWIRAQYCDRLIQYYAKADERVKRKFNVPSVNYVPSWQGYEIDVVQFCKK